MLLYTAILTALAPPFLLIILGYGLKRLRVLHPSHVPIFNSLVLNVTLPALVLLGLLRAPTLSPRLGLPVLALFLSQMAAFGVIYCLGRLLRLPNRMLGAVLMVGVFSNTSFIGYPLTLALFPKQFPTTILLDQFGMTLPMYLTAAVVGAKFGGGDGSGGHGAAIGRFFRSPIFLSAVLGLGLHSLPIPLVLSQNMLLHRLGAILLECLGYLGQGTTPLVLLALGVALRPGAALKKPVPLLLACGMKLLFLPLLVWVLCRAFGVTGEVRSDTVLETSMPTAVLASVLSGQNEMEGDFAVGVVFVATVLSALTIPLLLTLLR
ncbi:MAG: AEC family transporter [Janthinobacterium lividum]